MATAIAIEVLPARLGDCLLVECYPKTGARGRVWRMLVDGGPPDTWPTLRARLAALSPEDRYLDLLVITHIDADHIGGVIGLLADGGEDLTVGEVWFNGPPHLPDPVTHRTRSVAQGEQVADILAPSSATIPWNAAFDGAAVATSGAEDIVERRMPGGPRITVLSPTTHRLAHLAHVWTKSLDKARRGEPELPDDVSEPLAAIGNLHDLAASKTTPDRSAPNGSSIALLIEHGGASCLLTADAFANVLGAGLYGLAHARNVAHIAVDLVKLPHHTSRANITRELVAIAPAAHYVTSTNGDRFGHPDDIALARAAVGAPAGATFWFNYDNERTKRWAEPLRRHGHTTRYPRSPAGGLRIDLPEKTT
ncbi:ComEC/Rec2 family competence protein [Nocardia sp. NPDC055053]